jgi:hypothetical protein
VALFLNMMCTLVNKFDFDLDFDLTTLSIFTQYPGPGITDDRGLKFQRDAMAEFPRVASAFGGPLYTLSSLFVLHPDTCRRILTSSGTVKPG